MKVKARKEYCHLLIQVSPELKAYLSKKAGNSGISDYVRRLIVEDSNGKIELNKAASTYAK